MNRRYIYIATAVAVIASPIVAFAQWQGAPGTPPNSNAVGPVWLQTVASPTLQSGKISVREGRINSATTTQDIYVGNGKSIRADATGSATFNFGNYGSGATALTLGVYGDIDINGFNNNGLGTLYVNRVCLNNGATPATDCQTSWPSGGGGYPGDLFVNTVGDTMTGQLFINPSAAGQTALSITTNGVGADGIYVTAVEHGILSSATTGYGLSGNSVNSVGVLGQTANAASFGGIFYNNSAAQFARAVVGVADNCVNGASDCGAIGVDGFAANGTGVRGHSQNQLGPGVWGFGFYGVHGNGATGVRGDGTGAFGVEGRGPVAGVVGYGTGGAGTAGVRGQNSVVNAYGIYGVNSAGSGIGVYGETTAVNTRAIRGYANVSGGTGVQGEVGDANGIGVHGIAVTGNSGSMGVKGETQSPSGYGVYGIATSPSITAVKGETSTQNGSAVEGIALGTSSATNFASGQYSRGVYGFANQQYAIGVEGLATQANAYGVRGGAVSNNSSGVYGYSSAGTNGMGVRGTAFGVGGYGVYASAVASNGIGVYGEGFNNGIVGTSVNAGGSGVYGYNNTANGRGVYGEATNAGTGIGGWFNGALYDVNLVGGRINSAAATFSLRVAGTERMQITNTSPYAYKTSGGSWGTISDARLKNIKGMYGRGLDELMNINTKYFTFNGKTELVRGDHETHVGVIAQEVKDVIPEAVTLGENGYYIVNNDPIIWAMLNSVKELKTQNDTLKTQINDLNARLEKLEAAQ